MCYRCENIFTTDIFEDGSKIYVTNICSIVDGFILNFIYEKNNPQEIKWALSTLDYYDDETGKAKYNSVAINYCPWCRRKLEKNF